MLDISLTLPYRRWSAAAVSLDELIWRHLEPQWVQGYRLDDDACDLNPSRRTRLPRLAVMTPSSPLLCAPAPQRTARG